MRAGRRDATSGARWLSSGGLPQSEPLRRDRHLQLKGPAAVLAPCGCLIDTRGHEPSPQIAFRLEEDDLVRARPALPSVAKAVYHKDFDRLADQSSVDLGGMRCPTSDSAHPPERVIRGWQWPPWRPWEDDSTAGEMGLVEDGPVSQGPIHGQLEGNLGMLDCVRCSRVCRAPPVA
jgi:hypothetical protein